MIKAILAKHQSPSMTLFPYLPLLFLLFTNSLFGQTEKIEHILNSDIRLTERVERVGVYDKIFLETKIGSATIVNPWELGKLKDRTILTVELIFTADSSVQSEKQKALNRKRLQSLYGLDSTILTNETILWELVAQNAPLPNKGNKMFHGFAISFRTNCGYTHEIAYIETVLSGEDPSDKTLLEYANYWKPFSHLVYRPTIADRFATFNHKTGEYDTVDILTAPYYDTLVKAGTYQRNPTFKGGAEALSEYLSKSLKYPVEAREEGIEGTVYVSFAISKNGVISRVQPLKGIGGGCIEGAARLVESMPAWNPGITAHSTRPVDGEFILPIRFSLKGLPPLNDSIYLAGGLSRHEIDIDPYLFYTYPYPKSYRFSDSTIIKVLQRNQTWNKMLVVSDVSACMSPYTVQLLALHLKDVLQDSGRMKFFTFFIDYGGGHYKKIGDGKGIFHIAGKDFMATKELVERMMKTRSRDMDLSDNDVEALFRGIAECKNCNDVVVIADNTAAPRDTALASYGVENRTIRIDRKTIKVTGRPIHFILCGTEGGVNTTYMDIARNTKGSLHTAEEDIWNLAEMKEGERIKIGGKVYEIKAGKFVVVY